MDLTALDEWCCRCKSDFPTASGKSVVKEMGSLYPLKRLPKWMQNKIQFMGPGDFLCGNCYWDLVDEKEEKPSS